jgi:hypothetical protein
LSLLRDKTSNAVSLSRLRSLPEQQSLAFSTVPVAGFVALSVPQAPAAMNGGLFNRG